MLTIEYVKDLQWANAERTTFECVVKYAEFEDEHPSGITGTDIYAHTQEIWAKGNAGEYGTIAEYVAPEVVAAENQPTVQGAQIL
jgi:hypothetical protein